MAQRCITLLGVTSIQDYIFRSNRLKENLGASWIVADALAAWKKRSGFLFVGGGNAALEFDDVKLARQATEEWSFKLVKEYPGLRVAAWHEPVHEGEPLSVAYRRAQQQLAQIENRPEAGSELGSLPVVRECSSTGLGASDEEDSRWLSAEALAKTSAADHAATRLKSTYGKALTVAGKTCAFPDELGKLGQRVGASQIAIVHADGNGIGEIFQKIGEEKNDEEFRRRIRAASGAINTISEKALLQTVKELALVLPDLEQKGIYPADCSDEERKKYLAELWYPVRPIVEGGDDLTFVCHGRLGLALAARYLANFERESREQADALQGQPLTACAGVLIMPQKFPFARGYRLAERLTDSAKQHRTLEKSNRSWMDFQVLLEGSAGSLPAIRAGYLQGAEQVLRRPYVLEHDSRRAWKGFEDRVLMFQEPKQWPRSRAKRLLEALAHGQAETTQLLSQFKTRGIELPTDAWLAEPGAKTFCTPYFDPIELLDFHTPIQWPESQEKADATVN